MCNKLELEANKLHDLVVSLDVPRNQESYRLLLAHSALLRGKASTLQHASYASFQSLADDAFDCRDSLIREIQAVLASRAAVRQVSS